MTVRYDLSDRAVLITGGTSGIGRATAFAFVHAGASVAIAARNEEAPFFVDGGFLAA